jgi:hypothetical protein
MKHFESWLKRYWLKVATSIVFALAAIFRNHRATLIAQYPPNVLSETVILLTIVVLGSLPTLIYYFLRFKWLEKEVLKRDPTYYEQKEFDKAYNKIVKDCAQDSEP